MFVVVYFGVFFQLNTEYMGCDCLTFDPHIENKGNHCGEACQSFAL